MYLARGGGIAGGYVHREVLFVAIRFVGKEALFVTVLVLVLRYFGVSFLLAGDAGVLVARAGGCRGRCGVWSLEEVCGYPR